MTHPTDADEVLIRDDLGFRMKPAEVSVPAKEWFHTLREVRELRAEVAHLRERRDHLQTTNTRLVEERRVLKAELEARLAAGRSGEAA